MKTRLVDLATLPRDYFDHHPDYVYIGRPSEWGNPFKIGVDGTRDEVVDKYRRYITRRLAGSQELRKRLADLKGKILGCWCTPRKCHGDVLMELIRDS